MPRNNPDDLTDLGAWSASGLLTKGIDGVGVTLSANFKRPTMYTAQFFTAANENINDPIFTLAEIFWSVKGNSVRRLISVVNGQAISGTGEGVKIKVTDFSANTIQKPQYLASVLVTPGIRAVTQQPPILEIDNELVRGNPSSVVIAPAGNAVFTVPFNAGVNQVFMSMASLLFTPIPPEDILIVQRDPLTQTLKAMDYDAAFTWVPLSPACRDIRVFNNLAVNIIVTMTWGVEG